MPNFAKTMLILTILLSGCTPGRHADLVRFVCVSDDADISRLVDVLKQLSDDRNFRFREDGAGMVRSLQRVSPDSPVIPQGKPVGGTMQARGRRFPVVFSNMGQRASVVDVSFFYFDIDGLDASFAKGFIEDLESNAFSVYGSAVLCDETPVEELNEAGGNK